MKSIYSPAYQALLTWLRSQREAKDLTQRDVGARVGQAHTWVGKIEKGDRRLDVAEYVRLCQALEIDPGRGIAIVRAAAAATYTPAAPADLKAADAPPPYAAPRKQQKS
jgi:transcriptional regulator with XRE-family HTH domain